MTRDTPGKMRGSLTHMSFRQADVTSRTVVFCLIFQFPSFCFCLLSFFFTETHNTSTGPWHLKTVRTDLDKIKTIAVSSSHKTSACALSPLPWWSCHERFWLNRVSFDWWWFARSRRWFSVLRSSQHTCLLWCRTDWATLTIALMLPTLLFGLTNLSGP